MTTDTLIRDADQISWHAQIDVRKYRAVDEREAAFTLFPRQTRRLERLGVLGKGDGGGLAVLTDLDEIIGRGLALPHITGALIESLGGAPYDTAHADGNLLLNAGINRLGALLIGGGGQAYDATHSAIGVGDTATAAAATQTDLQAAIASANRWVQVVDSAPTFVTQVLTMIATFASANGNFVWNEWGIGQNVASAAAALTAPALNRKVASLGTKTVSAAWTLQAQITIG